MPFRVESWFSVASQRAPDEDRSLADIRRGKDICRELGNRFSGKRLWKGSKVMMYYVTSVALLA